MIKAAIYARVSTVYQEDGFSIAAQLKQLQEYCIKNSIEIYKAYIDEGISGQKENRPMFQAMLKDAEQGSFNIILVHKFDRFARNVELSQKIKKQLHKIKINVVSITEPIEDSPMGFFVSGLHELMAEYYSKNLGKEVEKGQKERVLQGIPSGSVPLGYKNVKEIVDGKVAKKIIVDEAQAEVVRTMYEMYKNGMGFHSIEKYMNTNGIKTKRGINFDVSAISRILKNSIYVGKIKYQDELYDSGLPTIVDIESFNVVQSMRGNKLDGFKRRGSNKELALFSGLAICGVCNRAMQISRINNTKPWIYYFCPQGKKRKNEHTNEHFCSHTKIYKAQAFDEKILTKIKAILKMDAYIEADTSVNINSIMLRRKEQIQTELNRAKEAYLAGIFDISEYKEIKTKLETESNQIIPTQQEKVLINPLIKSMLDKLESVDTIIEKQSILHNYIKSIIVDKRGPRIIFMDFS